MLLFLKEFLFQAFIEKNQSEERKQKKSRSFADEKEPFFGQQELGRYERSFGSEMDYLLSAY